MQGIEDVKRAVAKLANGPLKRDLLAVLNRHCPQDGGGVTTQDTGDNGPGPK